MIDSIGWNGSYKIKNGSEVIEFDNEILTEALLKISGALAGNNSISANDLKVNKFVLTNSLTINDLKNGIGNDGTTETFESEEKLLTNQVLLGQVLTSIATYGIDEALFDIQSIAVLNSNNPEEYISFVRLPVPIRRANISQANQTQLTITRTDTVISV